MAVELPGVSAFKELTLELSADRVYVSGGGYLLDAPLPLAVDSDQTVAKFSKKSQTLKISAPEA